MSWTCFKVFVHPDWLIWIWRSPSHNLKSQWKCLAACKEKCLSHLLTKSRNYHSAQQSNDGLDLHITCWSIIQTVATSLAGKLLLPFQLKLTWTSLLVYINKTPSSHAGQLPFTSFVTHCTSWAGASWNVTIHDCLLCIYKKKDSCSLKWNNNIHQQTIHKSIHHKITESHDREKLRVPDSPRKISSAAHTPTL